MLMLLWSTVTDSCIPSAFFFFTQAPLDLRRITINLLLQNHEEYGQQSQKYVSVNTANYFEPLSYKRAVCKTCSYQRAHAVDLAA